MAHEEMVSPDLITAVNLRVEKDKAALTVEVTRNGKVTDVVMDPDMDEYKDMVDDVINAAFLAHRTEYLTAASKAILSYYEAECHIYQTVF